MNDSPDLALWLQLLGLGVSLLTIWQYYLMGHKHPWSFPIATIGWLAWDVYILVTMQWGLGVSAAVCTVLSVRGWVLWARDERMRKRG